MKIPFLDDAADAVGHFFSDIGLVFFTAFRSLVRSIVEGGGAVLIEAATSAVKAAQASGGTGAEKRDRAFAAVVSVLTTKGLPIIANAIYGAIEAAVAELKKDEPQVGVPNADPSAA